MKAKKRKAPAAATVRASDRNTRAGGFTDERSPAAARNQAASNVVRLFPASECERFDNPYALDPHFRVWVMWQNRLAVEAELPYENHSDLAKRYIRLMAEKKEALHRARSGQGRRIDVEMEGAFAEAEGR